jgi:hypothetical protein
MNSNCINIDRKKAWLIVCFSLLLQCCTTTEQNAAYETIRAAIPGSVQLEENKHIALMLYNPEGCPPCNLAVASLLEYPAYISSIGENSFIVFPSIRASELQDYDRMLKEYGEVNIGYINDKKLYKLLEQKGSASMGKELKWIGLNIKTKECLCFKLKSMSLPDSIFARFN